MPVSHQGSSVPAGAWRASLASLCLVLVSGLACSSQEAGDLVASSSSSSTGAPSVRGEFRWAAYREGASTSDAAPVHRQTWVRGPGYLAMEDNDLRGFLDGRFIYGWNQVGQIHTRTGRRRSSPRFGETELYRTLQRWDGIRLPADVEVSSARLQITVEKGPERPLDVMLYEVHKDWEPGKGGTQNDNTSPPRKGEVWWGEAGHGTQPWGLPGVGFASERHPLADTPVVALAEARYEADPRQPHRPLIFESEALASYVQRQARRGESLRFLVKVSDAAEDEPDTELDLYSANVGDEHQNRWRPRLELVWSAPGVRAEGRRSIHLENGRFIRTERLPLKTGELLAASFEPRNRLAEVPTLEVRGGRGNGVSTWRSAAHPREVDWAWAQFRVLAATQPIELGQPFSSRFRDTWVKGGSLASRKVEFRLVSPQGHTHVAQAEYQGDFTWEFSFVPEELGRWSYSMTQDFLKRPLDLPSQVFDVVLLDRDNGLEQLKAMANRLRRESDALREGGAIPPQAPAFWRLERAVLRLETPESLASAGGRERYALLTEIRELLGGRKVPAELKRTPLKRDPDGAAP